VWDFFLGDTGLCHTAVVIVRDMHDKILRVVGFCHLQERCQGSTGHIQWQFSRRGTSHIVTTSKTRFGDRLPLHSTLYAGRIIRTDEFTGRAFGCCPSDPSSDWRIGTPGGIMYHGWITCNCKTSVHQLWRINENQMDRSSQRPGPLFPNASDLCAP